MDVKIKLPQMSMTMQVGKIIEWLVNEGDALTEGQPVVSVEADKTVADIESPETGFLSQILVPANTEVQIGTVLAIISLKRSKQPKRRVSPAARKLAQKHGIDINEILGTGPDGTVVSNDIHNFLKIRKTGKNIEEREASTLALDGIRGAMAQRMRESHDTIVQATTVSDIDMTAVINLRTQYTAGFTAFVIKAATTAITDFPFINASLDKDRIILKYAVHMGVAVDTEQGLLVPVIRHTEKKSLHTIHKELKELADRARNRTLTADEQSGPTMTVTNSGVLGSLLFTPIIVLPQSATLGMGKVTQTPVVTEAGDQIVVRSIMYLCLSYDHRFIDGALAVRYLQRVKAQLEEPATLT